MVSKATNTKVGADTQASGVQPRALNAKRPAIAFVDTGIPFFILDHADRLDRARAVISRFTVGDAGWLDRPPSGR